MSTNENIDEDGYAWRHAFAYADKHISTDDAQDYATWYMDKVTSNQDDYLDSFGLIQWPSHLDMFLKFRLEKDI